MNLKQWSFPTAMVLAIFTLSCNTDPLKNAIDDFSIVVELEEINTGIGLAFYDKSTGELITQDVTVTFDEGTTDHTIDIFSDPLTKETFSGGFINVGIRNESMEASNEPLIISALVSSSGYLDEMINIIVADTGLVTHNIDLFPSSSPPSNHIRSELSSPRDEHGNPIPFTMPSEEEAAQLLNGTNPKIRTKQVSVNGENDLFIPFFFIKRANNPDQFPVANANEVKYQYPDGSSFTGAPSDFLIQGRLWSKNGEEILATAYGLNWGGVPAIRWAFLSAFSVFDFQIKENESNSFKRVSSIIPANEGDTLIIRFMAITPSNQVAQPLVEDYKQQIQSVNSETTLSWGGLADGARGIPNYITGTKDFVYQDYENPLLSIFTPWVSLETPLLFTMGEQGSALSKFFYFEYSSPLRSNRIPPFPIYQFHSARIIYEPEFNTFGYNTSAGAGGSGEVTGTLKIGIASYNITDIMDDGQATGLNRPDTELETIAKAHTYFDLATPDGPVPPIRINPYESGGESNFNSSTGVFNIQVPARQSGTLDSNLRVNISCSNPDQAIRVSGIPQGAVSVKYRQVGTTGRFKEAFINNSSWDYSPAERVLKGVTLQLRRVLPNTSYELNLTFMGKTEKSTITVTGTSMSEDVVAPDNFCSD